MACAAKHNVDGTLRHIDLPNLVSRRIIDKDLPIRHVHVVLAVDCHALTAALRKWLQIA